MDNDGSKNGTDTVTMPSITIKRGSGFPAERHEDYLLVALPLTAPRSSKTSRKTNVIGSTRGPKATFADFNGKPILVNAMAMVNGNRPAWQQRISVLLAKWEADSRTKWKAIF